MKANFPAPTAHVRFRLWTEDDRALLRRLNRDRKVMEFFPSVLSAQASDAQLKRFMAHQEECGFSVWPILAQALGAYEFAGFVGLLRVGFDAPFAPAVEIGWRMLPAFWGRGLATEAARACLQFGFDELGEEHIVSFTAAANQRSRKLMERLGMTRHPEEDFDHPGLPKEHPLRRHVLYRLAAVEFFTGSAYSPQILQGVPAPLQECSHVRRLKGGLGAPSFPEGI